jgi:hypothetical protein
MPEPTGVWISLEKFASAHAQNSIAYIAVNEIAAGSSFLRSAKLIERLIWRTALSRRFTFLTCAL